MNSVTFKGISSDAINGLIIQELPMITKSEMRVQITEIEGRDGDITDYLGYQAYDKNMKIGLYGNYDIDSVINFFNGSGQITFSNEPDKYYDAEILEQIDFKRLITFKETNVTLHTQPFKYLLDEQPVTLEINAETNLPVTNVGLEISKPIITLTGSGIVEILINGFGVFQVNIDSEYVTVNSLIEECYKDNLYTLKNRQMTGQFPTLAVGENTITWTGNLEKIEVYPKSRWL